MGAVATCCLTKEKEEEAKAKATDNTVKTSSKATDNTVKTSSKADNNGATAAKKTDAKPAVADAAKDSNKVDHAEKDRWADAEKDLFAELAERERADREAQPCLVTPDQAAAFKEAGIDEAAQEAIAAYNSKQDALEDTMSGIKGKLKNIFESHGPNAGCVAVAKIIENNLPEWELGGIYLTDTWSGFELKQKAYKLTDFGVTRIAEALKNNTHVLRLHLQGSNIGDSGAGIFAKNLETNTTLRELLANDNNIGDEGATSVAEMMKINVTIENLDLSTNQITANGATAVAEMITINHTLISLGLDKNQVGDDGAIALAEAMKNHKSIWGFSVDSNTNIGSAGRAALQVAKDSMHTRPGWQNKACFTF